MGLITALQHLQVLFIYPHMTIKPTRASVFHTLPPFPALCISSYCLLFAKQNPSFHIRAVSEQTGWEMGSRCWCLIYLFSIESTHTHKHTLIEEKHSMEFVTETDGSGHGDGPITLDDSSFCFQLQRSYKLVYSCKTFQHQMKRHAIIGHLTAPWGWNATKDVHLNLVFVNPLEICFQLNRKQVKGKK